MRKLTLFLSTVGFLLAQSQNVAVQLTEMNLLYKGIDNPVNIAVEGVKNEDLIIATSDYLTYANGNLRAEKELRGEEFVYVGKKENQDTVWLDTVKLRIHSLPQPTAQLGGIPNDGLPKGKASVLAQSTLLATMGAGFAYPLHYQITSYKFIIAFADKPPVMYSGNGPQLTGQMRRAMTEISGGDRILIEGIQAKEARYGFEANLSPVIITIRSNEPTYYKDENSFIYARITDDKTGKEYYLNSTYDIALHLDTFQNGIVDLFSQGKQGYFRTSSHFSNGTEVSQARYDDYGNLQYTQKRLATTSWEYTGYYPNKQIKTQTYFSENEVLQGTEEFADCYDKKLLSHATIIDISDSCEYDSTLLDLFNLFLKNEIAASGKFLSYYQNGKLKIEGNLILAKGLEMPEQLFCGTGTTYYTFRNSTVLDGEWKFYSEEGKLIETRKYDKGKRVK